LTTSRAPANQQDLPFAFDPVRACAMRSTKVLVLPRAGKKQTLRLNKSQVETI
jgi:hypothetical protein